MRDLEIRTGTAGALAHMRDAAMQTCRALKPCPTCVTPR
jgi:hypothetical protein